VEDSSKRNDLRATEAQAMSPSKPRGARAAAAAAKAAIEDDVYSDDDGKYGGGKHGKSSSER
jgi:hypothetical protein